MTEPWKQIAASADRASNAIASGFAILMLCIASVSLLILMGF